MSTTSIEWTDKTWGPVVGCTHKSPGCLHCYAETMAGRQVPMSAAQGRRSVYLRVIQPGTRKWRIDLVIVGGESGPKARPMGEVLASPLDPLPGGDLVRSLRDQCEAAGVAFFFKQWGGVNKAKAGRMLDGRTHDAMPEVRRG